MKLFESLSYKNSLPYNVTPFQGNVPVQYIFLPTVYKLMEKCNLVKTVKLKIKN